MVLFLERVARQGTRAAPQSERALLSALEPDSVSARAWVPASAVVFAASLLLSDPASAGE